MSEPSLAFLLSDDLQDKLATCDLPESLEGLISRSVCVDNAQAPRSELHSSPERLTLCLAMNLGASPSALEEPMQLERTCRPQWNTNNVSKINTSAVANQDTSSPHALCHQKIRLTGEVEHIGEPKLFSLQLS